MAEQNETGLIERLSGEYYNLTASEKKVADYLAGNRAGSIDLSISDLAEKSGVAEATLSRFVRSLGYKGFSDFKIALARSMVSSEQELSPLSGEIREGDSFSEVCRKLYGADVDAITQTFNLLDEEKIKKAADLIVGADKVFCMGQGGSMVIAEEAVHLFATSTCKFIAVADSHTQAIVATTMEKRDVLLYFSFSGATTDMIHTIAHAKERGAAVILVTHYPNAPGARQADVILQCGANENPLQLGSVAAKLSQIFLLDVLFSEVCMRNLEECRQTRSRIADALAEKHL